MWKINQERLNMVSVVPDVPEPPGRPLVNSFTSRSVNLSWTPPAELHHTSILYYLIAIREGEDGPWDGTRLVETPDNGTTFQVNELKPFTTYSFKIMAMNMIGRSEYSKPSYYTMTLRTVPSGRPIITAAHNVSSTSIKISWRPPSASSIHGEFLGYRIAYRRHFENVQRTEEDVREMLIKDPKADFAVIKSLMEFAKYLVSVQVVNPEGYGPSSTVEVSTDEGVPSMPEGVRALNITNTTVTLQWKSPESPNGIILGYRLYFMRNNNFTDVVTVRRTEPRMEHVLADLLPFTKYRFWLKAFTWKNEGRSSRPAIEATTDVRGPSAPIIANLTCKDEHAIFIEWERPRQISHTIDFYFIGYKPEQHQSDDLAVNVGQTATSDLPIMEAQDPWRGYHVITLDSRDFGFKEGKMVISNLTTNMFYGIQLQAATKSLYHKGVLYKGQLTSVQKLQLRKNCDQIQAFTVLESENHQSAINLANPMLDMGTGVLAGMALIAMVFILVIVAFVLRRRFSHDSFYYVSDSSSANDQMSLEPLQHSSGGHAHVAPNFSRGTLLVNSSETLKRAQQPIPVQSFVAHVAKMHQTGGFSGEFQALQKWEQVRRKAWEDEHGGVTDGDDQRDNRYRNIVAYEHSRVILNTAKATLARGKVGRKTTSSSISASDYINANFIDGIDRSRAYIATQGPQKSSMGLFWQMVWEQKVKVIVMMTNIMEGGQKKCDQYWPMFATETYGCIQVTHLREDILSSYVIRTFRLRHLRVKCNKINERYILQYHFTQWPDFGVPETPLPFLAFVRRIADVSHDSNGPVLVHCSAGVGRTGAFIVADAMLRQVRIKGSVDLITYLKHIRTQRNFLVQTEEQYVFLYEVLAEAIASGDTLVNRSYLPRYVSTLESNLTTDHDLIPWHLVDHQLKLATTFQPQEFHFASALKPCNRDKTRNFDSLPVDYSRVSLNPRPGFEGSDYINATWLPGFHSTNEFIITQHPLEQTITDFWRMLWEQGIRTVVVLTQVKLPEFGVFWPNQQVDIEMDSIRISFLDESEMNGVLSKDFVMTSIHSKAELSVRLVFEPPHQCSTTFHDIISSLKMTQSMHKQRSNMGTLLVVDSCGGTEAAIYCSMMTLMKQLDFEHQVDVYQYVKITHLCKPGLWRHRNDLMRVYRVLQSYAESTSNKDSLEDLTKASR
ncbi:hypothetical protein TCAL_12939 [Tigriopus californicus]|uniref:Uncharacterized protein n=1 Tax=Tigriopus californicus TaxID=6832 RepID=A0A553NZ40_TIGCA|nr:tyrosine-protein phosphatase 99A-like [Tigriopus californicus]TRY70690.1 hypothetical protein TCAL_12939 [Tigriopus californicus]